MAEIRFEDIRFRAEKTCVRAVFQDMYYFDLGIDQLREIGEFRVEDGALVFQAPEKKVRNKLNILINRGFLGLKSLMSGKSTVYIHRNSGIPLIGSKYFGIIDRNTTIVELRPATGCNMGCIYCSIDEGKASRSLVDYFVEKDYLMQELKKLLTVKECNGVEIYINPYGEPMLYRPIVQLVRDLSEVPSIRRISLNTNGTLLTEWIIDSLAEAGLSLLIVSLNSLDNALADKIAGCSYNVSHVLEMIKYAANEMEVHIAPVYLPGLNDKEIEKLINYSKEHGMKTYIQNYLVYRHGRRPVRPMSMDDFYKRLESWEKDSGMKLRVEADDLGVTTTKPLANPFRKGETVQAAIVCPGRNREEMLASAKGRVIQVSGCRRSSGRISVKITRIKHNLISGIYKN